MNGEATSDQGNETLPRCRGLLLCHRKDMPIGVPRSGWRCSKMREPRPIACDRIW